MFVDASQFDGVTLTLLLLVAGFNLCVCVCVCVQCCFGSSILVNTSEAGFSKHGWCRDFHFLGPGLVIVEGVAIINVTTTL